MTKYIGKHNNPTKVEAILRTVLTGAPVELTEACPDVQSVRLILENEAPFTVDGEEFDPCGAVFWNKSKSVAVLNFTDYADV